MRTQNILKAQLHVDPDDWQRMGDTAVNAVREPEYHEGDHRALWYALNYLNRQVMRMESILDSEED